MSKNSVFVKREKTLAEQIVTVVMVCLLMSSFLYYFLKQEQQLTTVGFQAIASSFSAQVAAIRAQWFMDKQPSIVLLKKQYGQTGDQEDTQAIRVNKKGWVDSEVVIDNCVLIWQQIMNSPLTFMNQPITILLVNQTEKETQGVCRYMLASGEYFEYNPDNGKVSNVLI
ncbi:MAG: hypothetical protein ACPG46_00880 [Thalassotalea sp.]